jgi:hypothetical protein
MTCTHHPPAVIRICLGVGRVRVFSAPLASSDEQPLARALNGLKLVVVVVARRRDVSAGCGGDEEGASASTRAV